MCGKALVLLSLLSFLIIVEARSTVSFRTMFPSVFLQQNQSLGLDVDDALEETALETNSALSPSGQEGDEGVSNATTGIYEGSSAGDSLVTQQEEDASAQTSNSTSQVEDDLVDSDEEQTSQSLNTSISVPSQAEAPIDYTESDDLSLNIAVSDAISDLDEAVETPSDLNTSSTDVLTPEPETFDNETLALNTVAEAAEDSTDLDEVQASEVPSNAPFLDNDEAVTTNSTTETSTDVLTEETEGLNSTSVLPSDLDEEQSSVLEEDAESGATQEVFLPVTNLSNAEYDELLTPAGSSVLETGSSDTDEQSTQTLLVPETDSSETDELSAGSSAPENEPIDTDEQSAETVLVPETGSSEVDEVSSTPETEANDTDEQPSETLLAPETEANVTDEQSTETLLVSETDSSEADELSLGSSAPENEPSDTDEQSAETVLVPETESSEVDEVSSAPEAEANDIDEQPSETLLAPETEANDTDEQSTETLLAPESNDVDELPAGSSAPETASSDTDEVNGETVLVPETESTEVDELPVGPTVAESEPNDTDEQPAEPLVVPEENEATAVSGVIQDLDEGSESSNASPEPSVAVQPTEESSPSNTAEEATQSEEISGQSSPPPAQQSPPIPEVAEPASAPNTDADEGQGLSTTPQSSTADTDESGSVPSPNSFQVETMPSSELVSQPANVETNPLAGNTSSAAAVSVSGPIPTVSETPAPIESPPVVLTEIPEVASPEEAQALLNSVLDVFDNTSNTPETDQTTASFLST